MRRAVVLLSVILAFSAGMLAQRALGRAKPRMWADVLLDLSTADIPKQTRVHVNLDHWEPGAESGRHRHPGPTLIVMLDGEVQEVLADGRSRALTAGQAFWRPARTEHNVKNIGDRPARGLAVHLDPAP